MDSFETGGLAVVVGSSGGIGSALAHRLAQEDCFARVIGYGRSTQPKLDLLDEVSIGHAAAHIASFGLPLRLVVDTTGFLHGDGFRPEKALSAIDPAHMAHAFAINAIGPALLMKHFLPLMAKDGKAVFATLSAKVGSISDNRLGGWYSYRAAKAALNQLVRTAAIELARSRPQSICVALHPGTVDTGLSAGFAASGLERRTPDAAARLLLQVIDTATPERSGHFMDYRGDALPW
ncbi:NAD(P)-dependent dehydrogenase (short-subunit alcohol dehydrogenase family) [Hoeflea marina]|uniref:NAD(P)-dependent dehydrogenase (Short-subunit alcohol dehydrogenase family) n=1 Tax=Hoeflea marina TaxID=274592 RepID=A0A317PDP6_9HYPH|nr:SDR family NAD(P)-dependent oxidoreductase [Hoeflea marina]PWV97520.1 NAD(P)-dependent dehydrogenase (short-subunit alcohol dehydrogenase family) [Hoeflea marina]